MSRERTLLSGNEAVALAAFDARVTLGIGYPGTPSTEILEYLCELGGPAEWAPNEKVALEVAIGIAFARGRSVVTMKHVGLNVASDPFFISAYTGVIGALVVVSADDPGMWSSQNEQDNRFYARFAGVPMLEPSDSQEAYDFALEAFELSERWRMPVLLRLTTRLCHSKSIVRRREVSPELPPPHFERDIAGRVMIPSYARPAHRRLLEKLRAISEWNESSVLNRVEQYSSALGIITSGISYHYARESAPEASILKLGMTFPLPIMLIRRFASSVESCFIIEEGERYLEEAIRAEGIEVKGKADAFRLGELNVDRVRAILGRGEPTREYPAGGRPPTLCPGCPHRKVFEILRKLQCIVSGDIGCYTLGALPPYESMDSQLCMGASIGIGLGLRHSLPPEQARRVVSVIGDSTFFHSGTAPILEMVYNRPQSGHIVIVLDNESTAMTGHQEHPGTGRALNHSAAKKILIEEIARAVGVEKVYVIDPVKESEEFERRLKESLQSTRLTLIVARHPCPLAMKRLKGPGK